MVWKKAFVTLGAVGAALIISASTATAQMANDAMLKRGKTLFRTRGCDGCHGIAVSGVRAGPDLAGVTVRRSKDWLVRWLKDTPGMLMSDSTAIQLKEEWKGMKMPGQRLSDQEIDAILAFIEAETARKS
jgi:nitrite reductase (NO-forming)